MFARRLRSRMLDVAVAAICLGCIAAPFVTSAIGATSGSLIESSTDVDQRVLQTGLISNPLNGSFKVDGSGRADGKVEWDVYTSASEGFKLVVASDRRPAMFDENDANTEIADYGSGSGTPGSWSVGTNEREFGFSALGSAANSAYGTGKKWRGFDGAAGIEIARKAAGPVSLTRTTLKLRAEFGNSLGGNAEPNVNITGTAVMHL